MHLGVCADRFWAQWRCLLRGLRAMKQSYAVRAALLSCVLLGAFAAVLCNGPREKGLRAAAQKIIPGITTEDMVDKLVGSAPAERKLVFSTPFPGPFATLEKTWRSPKGTLVVGVRTGEVAYCHWKPAPTFLDQLRRLFRIGE